MDVVRAGTESHAAQPPSRVLLPVATASLTVTLLVVSTLAGMAAGPRYATITVQGEAAVDTNIPVATSQEAAGGRYLALNTAENPPSTGWYATYHVTVPTAGVYRLTAVITSPATSDRRPFGGSHFNLSVNGGPFTQVAKSEPRWANLVDTPTAWGSLVDATIDDVELHAGTNTVTFMVDELRHNASPQLDDPPQAPAPPSYRFFLDEFTLAPTSLALASIHLGDPATTVGTYRDTPEPLHFQLNGHATADQTVSYTITDYFAGDVASGTATIVKGETTASVDVPELPPGSYRVTAALDSTPAEKVVGYFARLPERVPTSGPDRKFAATTQVPWLVPPSRIAAFIAAMKDAGIGYVREEISWPLAEPSPGAYDTRYVDHIARSFDAQGIKTLGALWNMSGSGNAEAPDWAMTPDSYPLPADLRDGYRFANHLAERTDGIGGSALELWNEPDLDISSFGFSRSTGDQHAAYLKAAAIGVADAANPPLISLSGVGFPGEFHRVMLQNDVVRYADIWAYHGYRLPGAPEGALPPAPRIHNDLRRLYRADTRMWMTEAGVFVSPDEPALGQPAEEITQAQQRDQARYLVMSAIDSLAAGTDKHFWFSGAPYCAAGFACFGMLNQDFQPWPAYSAQAAMTSILGEADHARRVDGLPDNVTAHAFANRGTQVTVVWADEPVEVAVPVSGDDAELYSIMGERTDTLSATDSAVSVTAGPDPVYVVDSHASTPPAERDLKRPPRLTAADRIVLNQRFTDAAPQPPPFGYRLAETTPMVLEIYNFNDTHRQVTVTPKAFAGWSIDADGATTVTVPGHGRVEVPFTITADDNVAPGVDYPLVFDATLGRHGRSTTPSVSRIQVAADEPGEPLDLAPRIDDLTADVTGRRVAVRATVTDDVSGIDPDRVTLEIDGRPVRHHYDPTTGRLSATRHVGPGEHNIWVRAYNKAHAPTHDSTTVTVGR